jgi:hypothetical protein
LFGARAVLRGIQLANRANLEVVFWGKNLTDEEYVYDAITALPYSGRATPFGEKRTYGVDVKLTF